MTTAPALQWQTSGGEAFAISQWSHADGRPFVYGFAPRADCWINRSTSELIACTGADRYADLADAQAWAEATERNTTLAQQDVAAQIQMGCR